MEPSSLLICRGFSIFHLVAPGWTQAVVCGLWFHEMANSIYNSTSGLLPTVIRVFLSARRSLFREGAQSRPSIIFWGMLTKDEESSSRENNSRLTTGGWPRLSILRIVFLIFRSLTMLRVAHPSRFWFLRKGGVRGS